MKRNSISKTKGRPQRLTALLIAVVFVLGTAVLPTENYGAETETTDSKAPAVGATDIAATEAAAVEDNAAEEPSTEAMIEEAQETIEEAQETIAEDAASEATTTENVAEETEEETEADEAVVEELIDVVAADLEAIDESEYDGFIYKLADDTTTNEITEMESVIDELEEGQEVGEVIDQEIYTADSIETIAEVVKPEAIEYIEPNYYVKTLGPNDPYYVDKTYGWYLDMIKAPYVWNKGMFGKSVIVAILDSGVKMNHEEIASIKFTSAYNAIDGTVGNMADMTDNAGHGTAVTGIIAATYNNGKGLTGIAPGATIMPVKVMDYNLKTGDTRGSVADVVNGIDYAVKHGAKVINISAGIDRDITSLREACQNASAKGVILVAAAGNDGNNTLYYPASYNTVVSVGSIERDGNLSSFSNHNKCIAVTAPGRSVKAPYKNGGYASWVGTSFSAPQVTAMAAMVKALDPSVKYAGFMDVIKKTSTDKGIKGYDYYYGYGLMDLSKAYRYVAGDIFMYSASLSTTSYVYNNTVRTPAVTLKNGTKTLARSKYTVTYPTGRKAVGTYKVTVKNKGKFTGSKTLTFKIMPPLVRALKSPVRYKKKLKVRWYAMTSSQKTKYKGGITGYQVRVSRNSNFSNAKYVKVTGATKTYAVVKNLKRKTTYYIQYRSYKTVGSTTYYSKWSSKKKTRTR